MRTRVPFNKEKEQVALILWCHKLFEVKYLIIFYTYQKKKKGEKGLFMNFKMFWATFKKGPGQGELVNSINIKITPSLLEEAALGSGAQSCEKRGWRCCL